MKKLIAILLAAALVSLLCSACGSSKAPTNSASDPNTEVSVLDENEYSSELQTFIAAVNKGNYLGQPCWVIQFLPHSVISMLTGHPPDDVS